MTKRILAVLSVAALMAAMVAVATLPALAAPGSGRGQPTYTCEHPLDTYVGGVSAASKHLFVKDGFTCQRNS